MIKEYVKLHEKSLDEIESLMRKCIRKELFANSVGGKLDIEHKLTFIVLVDALQYRLDGSTGEVAEYIQIMYQEENK